MHNTIKDLQLATPLQPNRVEIINLLRIGLAISFTGLVLAFLASETTVVSIIATAIADFAKVEPKISSSLAGTAISVALMPPVCVIGLGLSQADWKLSIGATLLYATNLLGITLSCMLVYLITGCSSLRLGGKALRRTAISSSVLIIPLGIGFARLWGQKGLEVFVQEVLVNQTTTFKGLRLVNTDLDWSSTPL